MTTLVLLFGVLTAAAGLYGLVHPTGLVGSVQKIWQTGNGLNAAIVVRLAMGVLLLMTAPEARHPLVFQILGITALIAAIALPFMGNERLGRLIDWWMDQGPALMRVSALFAIAMGGYLVYAIT